MSSEDGQVYILSNTDDEEWVQPTPARTAIVDAVTAATDLDRAEIDDIEEYVEPSALRSVLDGNRDALTVTVEGHDVTVTGDGDIEVE